MIRTTLNVFVHLLDPRLRPTMVQKVQRRVLRFIQEREPGAAAWAAARAEDGPAFCKALDPVLWQETEQFVGEFRKAAAAKLSDGPVLGGGGNYHLLYFVTRLLRPENVLETGVAAGFSTGAILTALERNGRGHLYSSEFPYFRLSDPARYIGVLVPEELKYRWTMALDGDSISVPRFLARMSSGVDLFHYDSDKTYAGRKETFAKVMPRLSKNAIAIVDDIEDNFHFRDLVSKGHYASRVFGFEGKYCGLIEPLGGSLLGGATGRTRAVE